MRLTRTVATTREKPAEQARGSAIQANARQLYRIQQIAPVESQPRYSLIERDVEPDIPMGSGMLMGGMTHEWIEHWPRTTGGSMIRGSPSPSCRETSSSYSASDGSPTGTTLSPAR